MENKHAPSDKLSLDLLGPGGEFNGVTFTLDQVRRLRIVYKFNNGKRVEAWIEEARKGHLQAVAQWEKMRDETLAKYGRFNERPPLPFDADGLRRLYATADDRNVFRLAERDGLRVLAFLARYLNAGEDPLKLVIRLAADADYDVSPDDVEWADEVDE